MLAENSIQVTRNTASKLPQNLQWNAYETQSIYLHLKLKGSTSVWKDVQSSLLPENQMCINCPCPCLLMFYALRFYTLGWILKNSNFFTHGVLWIHWSRALSAFLSEMLLGSSFPINWKGDDSNTCLLKNEIAIS